MTEIESVFRRNNLLDALKEHEALLRWDEVVGARLGRYTRSEFVRDRVLIIRVSSGTVAHELSLLKPRLLERLNAGLSVRIRDVRFVQGPLPRPRGTIPSMRDTRAAEAARALFGDLEDETLAQRFERLVISQKDREASLLAAGGRRCPRCGTVFHGEGDVCPGCRYDPIDAGEGTN